MVGFQSQALRPFPPTPTLDPPPRRSAADSGSPERRLTLSRTLLLSAVSQSLCQQVALLVISPVAEDHCQDLHVRSRLAAQFGPHIPRQPCLPRSRLRNRNHQWNLLPALLSRMEPRLCFTKPRLPGRRDPSSTLLPSLPITNRTPNRTHPIRLCRIRLSSFNTCSNRR